MGLHLYWVIEYLCKSFELCSWFAAAAAKPLQSCPTLCDPIDGSQPGSPIPGILQARTLEWVAISFSNAWKWKGKVKSLSRVRLLAVQGTLNSLLQHHSSKASILRRSAFFTVQLSYPYMTTGKTIALTSRTFVGKVMSLLLNMLSRLVITFLPRSKCFLEPPPK